MKNSNQNIGRNNNQVNPDDIYLNRDNRSWETPAAADRNMKHAETEDERLRRISQRQDQQGFKRNPDIATSD